MGFLDGEKLSFRWDLRLRHASAPSPITARAPPTLPAMIGMRSIPEPGVVGDDVVPVGAAPGLGPVDWRAADAVVGDSEGARDGAWVGEYVSPVWLGACDGEGVGMVGDGLVGEAVVGACVVGDALVGEVVVGEAVVGEAVVGEAVVGEAVVGECVVGDAVVGEADVGDAEVGDGVGDGAVPTQAQSNGRDVEHDGLPMDAQEPVPSVPIGHAAYEDTPT